MATEWDDRERAARAQGLLPGYLTAGLPGTGGRQRRCLEDFVVHEIPSYRPSGGGQHTLFEIEKRGLTTHSVIEAIAGELGIPSRRIGFAGLKDRQAITRQHLSIEGVSPDRVSALQLRNVTVLWAERHRNRLKIGHLRGNRFLIRIRDVSPGALGRARRILEVLQTRGVPNGFGYQRFGVRRNTHLLGQNILTRDSGEFFHLFLGSPLDQDSAEIRLARQAFDSGDLNAALALWPRGVKPEWAALATLARTGDTASALDRIPKQLKRLYVSAYQSVLFNRLLTSRLGTIDRLYTGDLAIKHDNGAFFLVQDAETEQPRADRLEISPSGPLFGYKGRLGEGIPGSEERRMLADARIDMEDWRLPSRLGTKGGRRAYRVPMSDVELAEDDGLVIGFTLPAGSYATSVLAEVMK